MAQSAHLSALASRSTDERDAVNTHMKKRARLWLDGVLVVELPGLAVAPCATQTHFQAQVTTVWARVHPLTGQHGAGCCEGCFCATECRGKRPLPPMGLASARRKPGLGPQQSHDAFADLDN